MLPSARLFWVQKVPYAKSSPILAFGLLSFLLAAVELLCSGSGVIINLSRVSKSAMFLTWGEKVVQKAYLKGHTVLRGQQMTQKRYIPVKVKLSLSLDWHARSYNGSERPVTSDQGLLSDWKLAQNTRSRCLLPWLVARTFLVNTSSHRILKENFREVWSQTLRITAKTSRKETESSCQPSSTNMEADTPNVSHINFLSSSDCIREGNS